MPTASRPQQEPRTASTCRESSYSYTIETPGYYETRQTYQPSQITHTRRTFGGEPTINRTVISSASSGGGIRLRTDASGNILEVTAGAGASFTIQTTQTVVTVGSAAQPTIIINNGSELFEESDGYDSEEEESSSESDEESDETEEESDDSDYSEEEGDFHWSRWRS